MKNLSFSGFVLLVWGLMAACAKHAATALRVEIFPNMQTRVSGLWFEPGDRIGLTIRKGSETYVQNYPMTYDGAVFADDNLLWYDDVQQTATLTACYPYSPEGLPEEFALLQDQRAGYGPADLLGAVAREVSPSGTPVAMLFRHLMTRLSIIIDNATAAAVTEVAIDGFATVADVDLTVPTAVAKSGALPARIQAFEVEPGLSYRAILVPQQGDLTVTVVTSDGRTASRTVADALLESGKRYDLSVQVVDNGIELSLAGEIADWEEGGSLGGSGKPDLPDEPENPDEEAPDLVYEGVVYPTLRIGGRLWMAGNLRCQPASLTQEVDYWYPQSGFGVSSGCGLLYTCTAAMGGKTADGTPVQGICPDGWHIPDTEELAALAADPARPDDFLKCDGFRIVTASSQRYGDSETGYLMGCELTGTGKCRCLCYQTGADPVETEVSVNYGITVRCVQD